MDAKTGRLAESPRADRAAWAVHDLEPSQTGVARRALPQIHLNADPLGPGIFMNLEKDMECKHTAGPWRWEFNQADKSVHLVGGVPQHDLTIMDFTRWGWNGAGIRLREPGPELMNIMHKLHDRQDWIAAFPGRDHHINWCANVIHPDMRLMAAAPCLLASAQAALDLVAKLPVSGAVVDVAMNLVKAITSATGQQPNLLACRVA